MTTLTAELSDQIVESIHQNQKALADSLNSNLGMKYDAVRGRLHTGAETACGIIPDEPGIAVTFDLGGQGLVVFIPESLPLPRWYRAPNDSQSSRLQTLPMEWSFNLFPSQVEPTQYASVCCGSLREQLSASRPAAEARIQEIQLLAPLATTQQSRMWVVWPVATPQLMPVVTFDDLARLEPKNVRQSATEDEKQRRQRLLRIPVKLVVRIAEKKADLRQIRGFSPGTLLTFNKSCEALLDVYVGNHLYCRGEAVKVGENFGIKINEMNAELVRERKVHRV